MPVQGPQWSEYLSCPVCKQEFEVRKYSFYTSAINGQNNQATISVSQATKKPPVSLACGHTVCRTCLDSLQMRQCPFDSTLIGVSSLDALPVNTALLQLIGSGEGPAR